MRIYPTPSVLRNQQQWLTYQHQFLQKVGYFCGFAVVYWWDICIWQCHLWVRGCWSREPQGRIYIMWLAQTNCGTPSYQSRWSSRRSILSKGTKSRISKSCSWLCGWIWYESCPWANPRGWNLPTTRMRRLIPLSSKHRHRNCSFYLNSA